MNKEEWQKKGKGHRARLRDRFLDGGIEGLNDADILELLLSFGTPRSDCKEAARAALQSFGSLAGVMEAPVSALAEIKGIGPKNSFAIHFVQAVSRRYLKQRLQGKQYLHSSNAVREYLLHSMRDLKKEVLAVIFLDATHAIIDTEVVAEGTINVNTVYPRELIKRALEFNAAAMIIAHNHPSGSLTPSAQDLHLTKNIYLLCTLMQITLLDHFIIGENCYSFSDNGLMMEIKTQVEKVMQDATASKERLG